MKIDVTEDEVRELVAAADVCIGEGMGTGCPTLLRKCVEAFPELKEDEGVMSTLVYLEAP
jgi:hypothetical protein